MVCAIAFAFWSRHANILTMSTTHSFQRWFERGGAWIHTHLASIFVATMMQDTNPLQVSGMESGRLEWRWTQAQWVDASMILQFCIFCHHISTELLRISNKNQLVRRHFRREWLKLFPPFSSGVTTTAQGLMIMRFNASWELFCHCRYRTLIPSKSPAWKADGWNGDGHSPTFSPWVNCFHSKFLCIAPGVDHMSCANWSKLLVSICRTLIPSKSPANSIKWKSDGWRPWVLSYASALRKLF